MRAWDERYHDRQQAQDCIAQQIPSYCEFATQSPVQSVLAAMLRWMRCERAVVFAALAGTLLFGCPDVLYAKTSKGAFVGKLTVEWVATNLLICRPDKHDPLVFTTSDARRIQPQLKYTDGGSVPRLFWSASDLGPWSLWSFAPGNIVHDWLFQQYHFQIGDWQSYDFPKSAQILAERIKTQMEQAVNPEPTIVYAIYEAVRSPVAENLWNRSPCKTPPTATTPQGVRLR